MEQQKEHDIAYLETRIRGLSEYLVSMSDNSDLEELILQSRQPGWTTPAEYQLVSGIVDAMHEHVKVLNTLRQGLLAGSRLISK